MKMVVGMATLALILGFAGTASAQGGEEATKAVDWNEAAKNAELMDKWVNGNDVEMATYYDEEQNALWSQPAAMSVEEATAELAEDPEGAGLDTITQWVEPNRLIFCFDDACNDYLIWYPGDFHLQGTSSTTATYHADNENCGIEGIERIYAKGYSATSDYCDANFRASWWDPGSGWTSVDSEDDWCSQSGSYWYYYLDVDAMEDLDYYMTSDMNTVRFKYYSGGDAYYTIIKVNNCIIK